MPDILQLIRDAYICKDCPVHFGFEVSPNGSYFKFPPLIGAQSAVDLLFVGINPRRSYSNRKLHDTLMTSEQSFIDLAANRRNGSHYIDKSSPEPHYHDHLAIIHGVFGHQHTFETCAAVTELFHCATKDAKELPNPGSPCADKYLPSVLGIVQPKAIIAVGSRVMNYFRAQPNVRPSNVSLITKFIGREFDVVKMPHPADTNLADEERQFQLDTCIANLRFLFGLH